MWVTGLHTLVPVLPGAHEQGTELGVVHSGLGAGVLDAGPQMFCFEAAHL